MQPIERTLAVMFADVSGSTSLYETLGDGRALQLISHCLGTMQECVERHEGQVVKTVGDELVCIFDAPDAAIQAASEMQARLEEPEQADVPRMSVRVGIHYGPVLEQDADIFGDSVNLCARVVGLAKGGQILTTRATVAALPPHLRGACRALLEISVKGKEEKISVYEVIWNVESDLTTLAAPGALPPSLIRKLKLSYKRLEYLLDGQQKKLSVGRGPENELVVSARLASRNHARLYLRDGKFVLADESSNGTFVRFGQQDELMLRREETVLVGRGVISLGESTANGDEVIEFEVL
jgi:class 3 adenylate cyclase